MSLVTKNLRNAACPVWSVHSLLAGLLSMLAPVCLVLDAVCAIQLVLCHRTFCCVVPQGVNPPCLGCHTSGGGAQGDGHTNTDADGLWAGEVRPIKLLYCM